jgi:hypothetical protein
VKRVCRGHGPKDRAQGIVSYVTEKEEELKTMMSEKGQREKINPT